ncbi:MAG TPA: AI-2E family transporter [Bryobacteraceae bacterium]|jgi:predicted PurR-regulated permease PerM|nr:AI-2E family transporter [Bryobacteraceae bacterium]
MLGIDARAARYTWTATLVLLLLWLVYLMRTTLFVFIVALLFGYLLSPLVDVIDRFLPGKRTRTPALAIAYLIFIAALFVGITQIGSRAVEEASSLVKSMPAKLAGFEQPNSALPASVNAYKAQIVQKVEEQLNKNSGDIISSLPRAGAKILSVASNLVYFVIVPILGFFFLKDGRDMRDRFLEMIDDPRRRAILDDLLVDVDLLLAHYMRAVLTLSLATFTAYSIFFTILQVPYSILLAALAATLEFIPIIGPVSAGVVIVIVAAVSGGPVLGALIFLGVYRIFQDYVLSPLLMRAGTQVHPLLVLFGVFAGSELAGVPGAFLSVPALALIRIVYRRIRQQRLAAGLLQAAPADRA